MYSLPGDRPYPRPAPPPKYQKDSPSDRPCSSIKRGDTWNPNLVVGLEDKQQPLTWKLQQATTPATANTPADDWDSGESSGTEKTAPRSRTASSTTVNQGTGVGSKVVSRVTSTKDGGGTESGKRRDGNAQEEEKDKEKAIEKSV